MSSFTSALILEDTGDGRFWSVFSAFDYNVGAKGSRTYIPIAKGFLTDLASIPRLLRSVVPVHGRGNAAAVVHDRLYRHPYLYDRHSTAASRITRLRCDQIFYEALRVQGASKLRAQVMYRGVRFGGWVGWGRYRKEEKELHA